MARQMKDSGIEWIGEIPETWRVSKMKYIGDYVNGYAFKPEQWGDKGKRIIRIQDLTHSSENPNYYDGAIDPKYHVTAGDILVSWAATLDAFIWDREDGWLNQHIFKATPVYAQVCYDFFFWMIKEAMQNMNNDNKHGIMMQHVTLDVFGNFSVPLPSIPEQQRIAAFLDRKCAEIDAVIERTKATIEEYKKLKQAVITEAVTKGVRGPRPMKDSGIEWIGEIPEGWDTAKLGGVTLSMRNGYVGPTRDLFFETGIRYIQSLHIKDGVIDFDKHPYYVAEEWANEHPKVHTNDILIVQTGDIGQVGIVEPEYDGCNCHALIIATPDCALLSPRYLMFYLMSTPGKELLLSYKTGALLPHLNAGKIKFTPVLLPALDEQDEIVFYLDEKCSALDTLIAKKTALLTELETYKKSLIYEYVTGKKGVL